MKKRDLELKKMRERIAKRKASESERRKLLIENLSKEIFCEILDGLPLDFKFKLTNISKDFDGYWEKTIFEDKAAWHQDGRFLFSSSFYEFRDKVFDEIDKEKNIYYKVKRNWQRLTPKLINDKITQFITGKKGEITKTLTKEKLEELYYEQKKSLEDIAKEYACSRVQVMKIMKKCGLIRRRRSKARVEAIKKGKFEKFEYYDINENFFSEWSPEMAWVLGLLFTDGTIDNTRVAIHSVDIDLLEKIRSLLKSSKPIPKRTQSYDKSKHIYEFGFYREKMRNDLYKLGLQERALIWYFPMFQTNI